MPDVLQYVRKSDEINFPAGTFMWSVGLGGPLLGYLVHHNELKSSTKSFFWPMFAWCIVIDLGMRFLLAFVMFAVALVVNNPSVALILGVVCCLAFVPVQVFIMGKLAAARMNKVYMLGDLARFKKNESLAIKIIIACIFIGLLGLAVSFA